MSQLHYHFTDTEKQQIKAKYKLAKQEICNNFRHFVGIQGPVLIAGQNYNGIWLEHNQDNLFIAADHPEVAWNSQQVFMDAQREDGLLPAYIRQITPDAATQTGYGHIQSVFPFAECAMRIAEALGKPEETFSQIYSAASRYDRWFCEFRNSSGTGLVEMFCEYDTGHDHSPRVRDGGIPSACPGNDSANMPALPIMPVLSVDLSAMLYGQRIALANLAERLGRTHEQALWMERAEELKHNIHRYLYDDETDFYYDRDQAGFRKYRTEHITRLFLNNVLDQTDFDRIFERYFCNECEFWTPMPFPSMSIADPAFNHDLPFNCWGANTQCLTLLRALLWMESYGKTAELDELIYRWLKFMLKFDNQFTQELSPFDGSPIGNGKNYSPSLILFIEASNRLGVFTED